MTEKEKPVKEKWEGPLPPRLSMKSIIKRVAKKAGPTILGAAVASAGVIGVEAFRSGHSNKPRTPVGGRNPNNPKQTPTTRKIIKPPTTTAVTTTTRPITTTTTLRAASTTPQAPTTTFVESTPTTIDNGEDIKNPYEKMTLVGPNYFKRSVLAAFDQLRQLPDYYPEVEQYLDHNEVIIEYLPDDRSSSIPNAEVQKIIINKDLFEHGIVDIAAGAAHEIHHNVVFNQKLKLYMAQNAGVSRSSALKAIPYEDYAGPAVENDCLNIQIGVLGDLGAADYEIAYYKDQLVEIPSTTTSTTIPRHTVASTTTIYHQPPNTTTLNQPPTTTMPLSVR